MGETRNSDGCTGVRVNKQLSFSDEQPLTTVRLTVRNDRSGPVAVLVEDRLPTAVTPANIGFRRTDRERWRLVDGHRILHWRYVAADSQEAARYLVQRGFEVARHLVVKPKLVAARPATDAEGQSDGPPSWDRGAFGESEPAVDAHRPDLVTDGGRPQEGPPFDGDRQPREEETTVDVVDSESVIDDLFDDADPSSGDRSLGERSLTLSSKVSRILDRDAETLADGGDDPSAGESLEIDLDDRDTGTERADPRSTVIEGSTRSADRSGPPSVEHAKAGVETAVPTGRGSGDRPGPPPRHLEVRVERLETRLSELDAYTDSLRDLVDERETMGERLEPLREQLVELEDSVAELSATIQHVEAAKEIEHERLDDLDGRVASVTDELDELQETVGDVMADDQRLSDDLGDIEDRIERFATENGDLSGRVDDFDDRLAAVESAVESIDEVRATQERILDFFDALSTAGSRIDDVPSKGPESNEGSSRADPDRGEGDHR